jgi:hypothetical protein
MVYFTTMDNTPESNFAALGLNLPPAPKPVGVYKPLLIVDKRWVYVSGHGTVQDDGTLIIGRIGKDLDADARQTRCASGRSGYSGNIESQPRQPEPN